MQDLGARVDSFPEGWRPEPDEKIVGTVDSVDEFEGKFGAYPVLTIIEDGGGDVSVHCFHTVLKREVARQRPEPGDRIAIKYFGRDEERGYERYRVIVEKETGKTPIDWSKHERDAEEELAGDGEDFAGLKPPPEGDGDDPE